MEKKIKLFCVFLMIFALTGLAKAEQENEEELKVIEAQAKDLETAKAESGSNAQYFDSLKYTLGPEDVIEIIVLRHPEFSGIYPINQEGKIQYKFVGDVEVNGLTKKELEEKIKKIISMYVIDPEVNITITEYKSKTIYVLGEVGTPGKYYIKSDTIPVREAVVNAGLPTSSAAMRRCRIITPDKDGKVKTRTVDLYTILYLGDLKNNFDMHPGDVLYVPATMMAKVIRVINPITTAVGVSASGPQSASSGKAAVTSLAK
jgi:protein involved in polysaccharide export with SLBB domain